MNILDIIFILIVIFSSFSGYIKGFVQKFFEMFSFIIGFLLFKFIYPIIKVKLSGSYLFFKIENIVLEYLNNIKLSEDINFINYIKILDLPKVFEIIQGQDSKINIQNLNIYIADFIANILLGFISILLCMLFIRIGFKIISKIIKFLPGISFINKIFGLFLGIFNGIIIVWLLGIFVIVLSIFPSFSFLRLQLDSVFLKYLIFENPLFYFLINKFIIRGVI